MIDLYTFSTANGQRAAIALEEGGLPYRVHRVDLAKGEQNTPAFLKLNPTGAIPVIVDPNGPGGKPLTLAQSGAIAVYAAEKSGRLLPADPLLRLAALQWLFQAVTDVARSSNALFHVSTLAPDKTAANATYFEQQLLRYLHHVDARLAGRDYLADEISIADLALYPVYAGRKALCDKAGDLENLTRWGTMLAARPGVARGMRAGQ